ncbi:MAG: bi-domain-containing oxidoreductase [Chloroflexi bacterium]|nr:bi-domain-containing oxidoreductase [Chloroflexota bacterium]
MKQVLQYRRSGATRVVDVPAPMTPAGGILVQNQWSLISPGTERMLVEAGGSNLLNTARQRPDLVRQVLDKAARDGVAATVEAVRGRLDVAIPLGYSCAGTVLEVGRNAHGKFQRGDRVACAGAGQANHAEVVAVASNLAVRVPDRVSLDDAAFVTVGAIALQGVRIADVRLGEACVVIGLGLVGQLTVQLLKAAGCRVFGIDVANDKVELARNNGADDARLRADPDLLDRVKAFTLGRGADAILITAAATSSDPVQLAPAVARDRAVVVAVGMIGMDLPRNAYYEKELQVRLSRSYGPGRYDRSYEEDGVDYPIGYVRWTEQRNMEAFLDLVAAGAVQPARLVTHRVPIAQAERAYQVVTGEIAEPSLGILLEYPTGQIIDRPTLTRVDMTRPARPISSRTVRVGVIGAGSFARAVLLPALKKMDVDLRGVATASAPSAQQTATRFGFGYATTDWRQVLDDDFVDAVLVATRHDLHASIAASALRAGKSVFLEKPMALSPEALDDLLDAWRSSGRVLQVGFNRRFAPTYQQLKARYAKRHAPLVMAYRVNAGAVAPTSWVVDPVQGGGRLVGEVCHMLDLLVDLAGAPATSVYTQPVAAGATDDMLLTLSFADGSIGTIVYASGGDRSLPKEQLEVLSGGTAAVLDDFRMLRLYAGGKTTRQGGRLASQDKGHAAELAAFFNAVRSGNASPVHPENAAHITRVTFAAVDSARTGLPVFL